MLKYSQWKFLFAALLLSGSAFADDFLYKTRPGDSLWEITEKHLTDISLWSDLKKMNNLADPDNIRPGTLIRIPTEWLKSQDAVAKMDYAIGDVAITPPQSAKIQLEEVLESAKGITLIEGTRVETGENGLATVAFADESKLSLRNNSSLVLEGIGRLGDGSLINTRIRLEQGKVESRVNPEGMHISHYEVMAPFATTSVRGTEFRVNADGEKTIAEVLEGTVDVSNKKMNQLVGRGKGAIVDGENATVAVLDLPPTVDAKLLPVLIERSPINLSIANQKDVVGYRMKITDPSGNQDRPLSDQTSQSDKLLSSDIPDGDYKMFVSSIAANGMESAVVEHDFRLNARPEPPLQITPTPDAIVTDKKVVFKWGKVLSNKDVRYRLQIAKDLQFQEIVVDQKEITKNFWENTEDLANGDYFWRILAEESEDQGPFSDGNRFKYLANTPELAATMSKDKDGILIAWRDAGEGFRYVVQISDRKDFDDILYVKQTFESRLDVRLFRSGIFYVRIQMIDEEGNRSSWSEGQQIVIGQ